MGKKDKKKKKNSKAGNLGLLDAVVGRASILLGVLADLFIELGARAEANAIGTFQSFDILEISVCHGTPRPVMRPSPFLSQRAFFFLIFFSLHQEYNASFFIIIRCSFSYTDDVEER